MAGNDRKPEYGTEAAIQFLAVKWQQPERLLSVDVKSWELRTNTHRWVLAWWETWGAQVRVEEQPTWHLVLGQRQGHCW